MSNNTVQQRNPVKEPESESVENKGESSSVPDLTPKQVEELEKLEENIKKLLAKQKEKQAEKNANIASSRKKIIEAEIVSINKKIEVLQARKKELEKELDEKNSTVESYERNEQIKDAQEAVTSAGETARSFIQNLGTGGGKKRKRKTRRTRRNKKHTRKTRKHRRKSSKKHHKKAQKKRRSGRKH